MIEKTRTELAREAEFVAFRAGGLEFCINIMTVREIRGWTAGPWAWVRSLRRARRLRSAGAGGGSVR